MTATLRCHCVAGTALKPLALEAGLHAAHCQDCGAVLLQMADWRRWRASQPQQDATAGAAPTAAATADEALADDHQRARHCPACARLMERLPIDAQGAFRVDRCGPCQVLWLDSGEWQALVQRGLALQLDTLLSDGGQRRIQNERLQSTRMLALRQRHGDACMDEVQRIRRWLAEQPHRDEVLALIRATEPLYS